MRCSAAIHELRCLSSETASHLRNDPDLRRRLRVHHQKQSTLLQNETPCLRRLYFAFWRSHSNSMHVQLRMYRNSRHFASVSTFIGREYFQRLGPGDGWDAVGAVAAVAAAGFVF